MNTRDTPTVALLRKLVAFDTTTRGSNIALIEFIERYLAEHGVPSRRVSSKDNRSNLYATIGPDDVPGIMLAGHTDVVPVEADKWTSDPFTLTERDGRYYGRGTADMKGFLAAVLAAVPKFVAKSLRIPVHLAFSYDEEIGCVGVRDLLEDMARMKVKPRWGVIGEPTSMQPAHAHKGKVAWRVHITGLAGHSRNPDAGANAIYAAAKLVLFIKDLAEKVRQTGVRDDAYDYPTTSLHVGHIGGGTALNIIPAACTFDFEIRYLPGTGVDDLLREIRTYAESEIVPALSAKGGQCGITFEELTTYPALATDVNAEPVAELRKLLDDPIVGKIGFGTEGGLYHEIAGVPCVVCGPGDMAQGHRPDEFVSAEQLAACDAFLDRFVVHARDDTPYLQRDM